MSRQRGITQILLYFFMLMFLMVIGCSDDSLRQGDTYSISGRVTLNGEGLADISVHLSGAEGQTVMTDANGEYRFSGLPDGKTYNVTPSSGMYTFIPDNTDVEIDGSSIAVTNFEAVACCGGITTNRVYVSNYDGNSVSVIDSTTNNVVSTIALGHPAGASAFLPELNRLYVTSVTTNNLTIVNTITNTVLTTITLPGRTGSVVVDRTTNKIYVAEYGDNTSGLLPLGTRIWVLNAITNALLNTINVGTNIQALTIDVAHRRMYVTDFHTSASTSGLLFPINIDTDTTLAGITCGILPQGNSLNTLLHRVYVTNLAGDSVTVINTLTNAVVGTIAVGDHPEAISVDETIDRALVTNSNNNNVSLINTADDTIIGSPIIVGTYPTWAAVDTTTHLAYVVNYDSDNVSVVNLQTATVIDTINVGNGPARVTVVE